MMCDCVTSAEDERDGKLMRRTSYLIATRQTAVTSPDDDDAADDDVQPTPPSANQR